jgi:hypothetical protein
MGSNSFLSKMYTYDPLTQALGKNHDPLMGALVGNGYTKSSGPGTPGPYAGVKPTLADANAGYVRAAAGTPTAAALAQNTGPSMNNLFGGAQQQPGVNPMQPPGVNPVPRPIMKAQPVIPGQQQQQTWG